MESNKYNTLLEDIKSPFFLYTFIFLIITMPLIFFSKGTIELWVNQNSTLTLDIFFKYYTYMGDAIIFGILLLWLLLKNCYLAILFTSAVIFSFLITNLLLKNFIFKNSVRPYMFFNKAKTLHLIEGVDVHSYHSFPSGHTSTAFLWIGFISLSLPKKYSLPLFISAMLVAFSRVYIFQHFFIDVYFGSLIGVLSIVLMKYLLENHTNLPHNERIKKGLIIKEENIFMKKKFA